MASGCAAPAKTTSGAPAASAAAFRTPGLVTALRAPAGQPPKPGPPTSPTSKIVMPEAVAGRVGRHPGEDARLAAPRRRRRRRCSARCRSPSSLFAARGVVAQRAACRGARMSRLPTNGSEVRVDDALLEVAERDLRRRRADRAVPWMTTWPPMSAACVALTPAVSVAPPIGLPALGRARRGARRRRREGCRRARPFQQTPPGWLTSPMPSASVVPFGRADDDAVAEDLEVEVACSGLHRIEGDEVALGEDGDLVSAAQGGELTTAARARPRASAATAGHPAGGMEAHAR